MPGRNVDGGAASFGHAATDAGRNRVAFFPQVSYRPHYGTGMPFRISFFLQGHVSSGRFLRIVQQGSPVPAETLRGKLRPLRRVFKGLQDGGKPFPSAGQPGVHTMRRLRQGVPLFRLEGRCCFETT